MSLVVSAYGANYIALGGDRGCWDISADGQASNPRSHDHSKLRVVPGCPMVLAAVGVAQAGKIIDRFIERKAYTPQTYRIFDAAKELWAEMFAEIDGHSREKLKGAGFDPDASIAAALESEKKEFVSEKERTLASFSFISAGIDYIGMPRFFTGVYPNPDIRVVNFDLQLGGCSGVLAMGSHDVLSGFDDAGINYAFLGVDGGVELCRFMLDTVDRAETLRAKTGGVRTVMGPYDLLYITRSGVEWVQGGESHA